MSLKSISQTRWKIEPTRVVIYPHGAFHIFAAVLAILFAGLLLVFIKYGNSTAEAVPFGIFLLIIVLVFWAFAATRVEFDNSSGRMRKMLMGFLPTASISFDDLQGIKPVSNMAGSYTYRLYRKNARYGKGIIVSSGYTSNDNPNAIAFVNEAVTAIHGYLDLHDTPADRITEAITDYKFFVQEDGYKYAIKVKKAGAIVIGLIFLLIGLYLTTTPTDSLGTKIFIIAIVLCFALVFINAAFTRITFDASAKMVERNGLLKFFNRKYSLDNFDGIQTVRRSVNFVYAGTDVNMYFRVPEKNNKQEILQVISLKKSADIERFIQELYLVMEK